MKKYNVKKLAEKFKSYNQQMISEDDEKKTYRLFQIKNSNNEVVHVISVDISDPKLQTPPQLSISYDDVTMTPEELAKKKQDLKQ